MSNATAAPAAEALEVDQSTTTPPVFNHGDKIGGAIGEAVQDAAAHDDHNVHCPCYAPEGTTLGGGLPFVLEVTMRVAGLPPLSMAEVEGTLGSFVVGPPVQAGGVDLEGVRTIVVQAPSQGDMFRAAGEALAGMLPDLGRIAQECDAEDAAAAAAEAEGEGEPVEAAAGCCKGTAATAEQACPGPSGPVAVPTPERREADEDGPAPAAEG